METLGSGLNNVLGKNDKHGTGTQVQNGLATPETTPAPEDARIAADNARRAAEAAEAAEAAASDPNGDQDMGGGGDDDDGGEYKPSGGGTDEEEEEKEAIKRVMNCGSKNYREILGVEEAYNSPKEEKTAILNAYRDLGTLIHPDFSDDDDAEEAFIKVKRAAKLLGVEEKYLREVEDWNGEDDFLEVEFSNEPPKTEAKKPKEGKKKSKGERTMPKGETTNPKDKTTTPKDQTTEPNDAIKNIYKLVGPFLELLLMDDADLKGVAALASMNEKIKAQNQNDAVSPVDRWTIDRGDLLKHYNAARPFYVRFLENEHDEEALQSLQTVRAEMAGSYPDTFLYPIIPDSLTRKAKADREAKEKADKEKADREAKAKADKEKADKEKAKVKGGIISTPPGKIKYPWTTHVLPDGREIIAGRRHSRRGQIGNQSTLIVASDQGEDPDFVEISGAAIGAQETDKYFSLPNIKILAETRENGEKAKTWTWRDKEHFVRLLWVTVGTINMTEFGKGRKSAWSKCCAEWDDGINICTRSDLKAAIEGKPADDQINAYCQRKGMTKPGDVQAEYVKVPKDKRTLAAQTWLAEQGLGNFAATPAAPSAGHSTSGWTAVNSPNSRSESPEIKSMIKSLSDRIAAMEKKLESPQSSDTSGNSSAILTRIEERLASMEKKVAQVDDLAKNMSGLSTVVERLLEKSGLGTAST